MLPFSALCINSELIWIISFLFSDTDGMWWQQKFISRMLLIMGTHNEILSISIIAKLFFLGRAWNGLIRSELITTRGGYFRGGDFIFGLKKLLAVRLAVVSKLKKGYSFCYYTFPKVQPFFCWIGCLMIIGWFNIQEPCLITNKLSANIEV